MFLAWLCFGILISNIILSNQLRLPAIITNTRCARENLKIQGFTPSQFFQCIRKGSRLYFEARYCPNSRNTFYETKQSCLPNIGGGEVRCQIPGKRCSHNILGTMAYPTKFKPNYYIVCLPNAVHICRCYDKAIYDKSIHMCRYISITTDLARDDSHGMIPKITCKKSGIHSIVELEYPYKQKCGLFCYQKRMNRNFELNIICARKTSYIQENVPSLNTFNTNTITEFQDDIPPEINRFIAQEFLKSTNSSDNFEWLKEESYLDSSSTEDGSTTWTADQNDKERSHSTLLSVFSTTEDEPTISTIEERFSSRYGSVQSDSDQKITETTSSIPFVTNDETTGPQSETTSLASSTTEYDGTQSVTDQNFTEITSSSFFSITQETTISTTEKLILASVSTQDGIMQSNSDQKLTSIPFVTDGETTGPPSETTPLASSTTEYDGTQSVTDQNFTEITSSSFFSITQETTISTTEKLILASGSTQDGIMQSNSDQKLTSIPFVTDGETTGPPSETTPLASSTTENGSTQSVIDQNFTERTSTSSITEEETTNSSTEDKSTKSATDQNIKETTSSSQLLSTDDEVIKLSSDQNSLTSLTTQDGKTQSNTDDNLKQSTSDTPSPITKDNNLKETTSSDGEGMQSTTYQSSKETTFNTIFSTTEVVDLKITDDESVKSTTDPNFKEITSSTHFSVKDEIVTPTSEDGNIQRTGTQNIGTESLSSFALTPSTTEFWRNFNSPSYTEFTSTDFAPIKSSINSLSQISTTESSNSLSETNTPTQNLEGTGSSSVTTLLPPDVTGTSKNDEENSSSTESSRASNEYLQSSTGDTPKQTELGTTTESGSTIEIGNQLPGESSTANDYYKYRSTIPASANTLLPADVISESPSENNQQTSTPLEPLKSEKYSTVTSSTGFSTTEHTTIFIEPADSDKDDYSTKAFSTDKNQYDETTLPKFSTTDDEFTTHTQREDNESTSQQFTTENHSTALNIEEADSDQTTDDSVQSPSEFEISTTTMQSNGGVTGETFASNENLEETELDPSSQVPYVKNGERCDCSGKMRFRNSCKKHYHCNKIGNSDTYVQSQIMECGNCFQFNAKKGICDFPENVPECLADDGSLNRICTAEGNYSIPLETNCRKYYECKRNWRGVIELQVKICDVGSIFSERLQKCVIGCRCRNGQQLLDRCEYKDAVLPDRLDCSKYYYCNNEVDVKTLQCSDQYVFDGERCELKSEVICDPTNVLSYLSGDDDGNCNK